MPREDNTKECEGLLRVRESMLELFLSGFDPDTAYNEIQKVQKQLYELECPDVYYY